MYSRRQLYTRVSETQDGIIQIVKVTPEDLDVEIILELTLAAAEELSEELSYRAEEGRMVVQYNLDQRQNPSQHPADEKENEDVGEPDGLRYTAGPALPRKRGFVRRGARPGTGRGPRY